MALSKEVLDIITREAEEGIFAQSEADLESIETKQEKGNKAPTLHYRGEGYGHQGEPNDEKSSD